MIFGGVAGVRAKIKRLWSCCGKGIIDSINIFDCGTKIKISRKNEVFFELKKREDFIFGFLGWLKKYFATFLADLKRVRMYWCFRSQR